MLGGRMRRTLVLLLLVTGLVMSGRLVSVERRERVPGRCTGVPLGVSSVAVLHTLALFSPPPSFTTVTT